LGKNIEDLITAIDDIYSRKYIWQFRDTFVSSSNSDVTIEIAPDSWMILKDSVIRMCDCASARPTYVAHRDEHGERITFIASCSLDNGRLHFPYKTVVEDATVMANQNMMGSFNEEIIIMSPDVLVVESYNTISAEYYTAVLRAILPDSTAPTVTVVEGTYHATNTYDYDTVTKL